MEALNKILTNTTSKLVKNVDRVDSAVDGLLDKFENVPGPLQDVVNSNVNNLTSQAQGAITNLTSEVTQQVQETAQQLSDQALSETQNIASNSKVKDELLKVVKVKNQLQSGLTQIYSTFSKISDVSNKTMNIVEISTIIVDGIKIMPSPPFNPDGLIASVLDFLDKFLENIEKNLGMVPPLAFFLTTATGNILVKLQQLDVFINTAMDFLTKDMTQSEKNEFVAEVGNVAATAGDFNSEALNVEDDKVLEESLSPLSSNPYVYQKTGYPTADWRLTIEHNQDNDFSFPQRRIRMENINDSEDNIYRGVVTYGPINNGWSFSSSVKVLIEEAKYNIEGLDDRYWARANRNYTPN